MHGELVRLSRWCWMTILVEYCCTSVVYARYSSVFCRTCHGPARAGPSFLYMMGRGPARPIKFSFSGPRPGPAHQNFRRWAAARPSPSHFQKFKARPDPTHHMAARPMRHGLYMGRPDNYVGRPVDLTGRPMCCPVLKGACAYADVILLR